MENKLTVGKSGKQFIIRDVLCTWAKVHTPTLKYKSVDQKEYSIELLINEATVDAIEDANLNKAPTSIKTKNKKAMKKKGEPSYPVEYEELYALKLATPSIWPDGKEKKLKVTMDGRELAEDIGNYSTVSVICRIGKKNDEGLSAVYPEAINVTDLVEYEGGDEFSFDSEPVEEDDIQF